MFFLTQLLGGEIMAKMEIKDKLRLLPDNPGCYLMKNKDDEVIVEDPKDNK